MWTYRQSTGHLSRDGQPVATGYSGHGAGRNSVDMEAVASIGPIPRGRWVIGPRYDSQQHGPVCMRLSPAPGTETHGRTGFLIHADSRTSPGDASRGCIVLPRPVRLAIAASGDTALDVV